MKFFSVLHVLYCEHTGEVIELYRLDANSSIKFLFIRDRSGWSESKYEVLISTDDYRAVIVSVKIIRGEILIDLNHEIQLDGELKWYVRSLVTGRNMFLLDNHYYLINSDGDVSVNTYSDDVESDQELFLEDICILNGSTHLIMFDGSILSFNSGALKRSTRGDVLKNKNKKISSDVFELSRDNVFTLASIRNDEEPLSIENTSKIMVGDDKWNIRKIFVLTNDKNLHYIISNTHSKEYNFIGSRALACVEDVHDIYQIVPDNELTSCLLISNGELFDYDGEKLKQINTDNVIRGTIKFPILTRDDMKNREIIRIKRAKQ